MAVRFRIRTSQGQELSFASHEIFEEFVRSGDLAPEDLVYDGETGEWAPARTHPLVLSIELARYEEGRASSAAEQPPEASPAAEVGHLPEASPAAEAERAGRPGGGGGGGDDVEGAGHPLDLDLDLALAPESLTLEEHARAFVEKMEAERALEREFGPEGRTIRPFRRDPDSSLVELEDAPSGPERAPPPRRSPVSARGADEPRGGGRSPAHARGTGKGAAKGGGAGRVVLLLAILGVAAAAVWLGAPWLGSLPDEEPADPSIDLPSDPAAAAETDRAPAAARPPMIVDSEDVLRERARERFLSATQDVVEDLPPVPAEWMGGSYVALPSEHRGVRELWQRYERTARSAREGHEARYRGAYERALDDAGVLDRVRRRTRLEAAWADFDREHGEARSHWDRVEALAVAGARSHDALLEAEGLILYDPSGSTGRTGRLATGTRGRDSDAQLLLEQVMQVVEAALAAEGRGPRQPSNVRAWVWDGFLDAVTRPTVEVPPALP